MATERSARQGMIAQETLAALRGIVGDKGLVDDPAALEFAGMAWSHLKALGLCPGGRKILAKANGGEDAFTLDHADAKGVVAKLADRAWDREPALRPKP